MEENNDSKMPITGRGLVLMAGGVLVMALGYIILSGGGSDDPAVFNTAMFDFRRLYLAPVVIICGVVMEIVAIMKLPKNRKQD